MKKILLTSVAAVAICGAPALAAPPAAQMFNWTGCYIGGHIGRGWGHKSFTDEAVTPDETVPADIRGWLAGGQLGCDNQFATNWVVGIEGAGSWANIKGSSDPFFGGKTVAVFHAQTKWIASTTARLGYTQNGWLIYVKGGPAWAGDKYQVPGSFIIFPFEFRGSETRPGWTVVGGIEWAFWQNWSAKLEYAYYDFGTRSLTFFDTEGSPDPARIKQRIQTVTFGINYRFWTGPGRAWNP